MTQQANVFVTSAPAGPGGDAAFVSATTAPRSFVFRPGAVFPNGGPVQQNVFTAGNAQGIDGLTVLQGVLNGLGLSPAIPLPSSTVELDFSDSSNAFSLAANLDLGQECTLKGIINDAPFNSPQLTTAGHTIAGLVELDSVFVFVSGATTLATTPIVFTVCGYSGLLGTDGHYFFDVGADAVVLDMYDTAFLGDGVHPVLHVGSGGQLTINLNDGTGISANALSIDSGGSVVLVFNSGGYTIDPSIWALTGVSFTFNVAPVPVVTFSPGGSGAGDFVDFTQLLAYLTAVGQAVPSWTINCDGSNEGNEVDLPAGTFALPTDVVFQGVIGNDGASGPETPILTFGQSGDTVFSTFYNVAFRNFDNGLAIANTGSPVFICSEAGQTITLDIGGSIVNGGVTCSGSDWFIDARSSGGTQVNLRGFTQLTYGGIEVLHCDPTGDNLYLNLFDNSQVQALTMAADEGHVHITIASPSALLDESYFSITNFWEYLQYSYAPSTTFVFQPSGTHTQNVFTDEKALAAYTQAFDGAEYTIFFDLSLVGGYYAFTTEAELNFAPNGTWTGQGNLDFNLVSPAGTTLANPPVCIRGYGLSDGLLITIEQTTVPICAVSSITGAQLTLEGFAGIESTVSGAVPFIDVQGGGALDVILRDDSFVVGTATPVFTASDGELNIWAYDAASLGANATDNSAAQIQAGSPGVVVDPSLYGLVTVTNLFYDGNGAGPSTVPVAGNANTFMLSGGGSAGALYFNNGTAWLPVTNPIGSAGSYFLPYSSRPAPGTPGSLFFPNDPGPIGFLDSGSAWLALLDQTPVAQVPAAANWTNLGSVGTFADSVGTLLVTPSTVSDTLITFDGWGPTDTTFTVALGQSVNFGGGTSSDPGFGIAIRNAAVSGANNGYIRFAYYYSTGGGTSATVLQVQRFTGAGVPGTPQSPSLVLSGVTPMSKFQWMRLVWNGGANSVTFEISQNGIDWVPVYTFASAFEAGPTIQVAIAPLVMGAGENICRVYSASAS
jgi:hypothetical protein